MSSSALVAIFGLVDTLRPHCEVTGTYNHMVGPLVIKFMSKLRDLNLGLLKMLVNGQNDPNCVFEAFLLL